MDLGPLRTLALEINLAAHGVSATVTRPAPDDTPVETTGIWHTAPPEDAQPYGTDFRRREPRRILALPRADLPTMPRGTTISAPETIGGTAKTWTVDGLERVEADTWRVLVTLALS